MNSTGYRRQHARDIPGEGHAVKFLSFRLGSEEFGIEILRVVEIIAIMQVTEVPRMPEFIRGVINLRGKIIPVFDLRLKFGMPMKAYNERTCIILAQMEHEGALIATGIIVDEVSEVLPINREAWEDTPVFGAGIDARFLLGVGKIDERVILLLDVDRILTQTEIGLVSQVSEGA